jgi:hypothetical protein
MIKVSNKKSGGNGIYIGRPSVLGNKFVIGRDGSREEVIEKYLGWLREEWKRNGVVKAELVRLAEMGKQGDVELTCWCAPAACHGDVIKKAIEKINGG